MASEHVVGSRSVAPTPTATRCCRTKGCGPRSTANWNRSGCRPIRASFCMRLTRPIVRPSREKDTLPLAGSNLTPTRMLTRGRAGTLRTWYLTALSPKMVMVLRYSRQHDMGLLLGVPGGSRKMQSDCPPVPMRALFRSQMGIHSSAASASTSPNMMLHPGSRPSIKNSILAFLVDSNAGSISEAYQFSPSSSEDVARATNLSPWLSAIIVCREPKVNPPQDLESLLKPW
eukprot:CAMPEP_0113695422 /NCGR_PEP_ID=MMETSP0038_2-20120614/20895_1 /TAXON_ID=2898 /ORGANISM="Cryptomonas paramecium" /LENGTH=229 /DNA_ID=CAMNT_0000617971 /DNA_START=15 /DNA_END=701 /DNA_ORIENTATION=+ /assembly_acc=CAM_ASM_000170